MPRASGRRQGDLGEPRGRTRDGLTEHLVVCQPDTFSVPTSVRQTSPLRGISMCAPRMVGRTSPNDDPESLMARWGYYRGDRWCVGTQPHRPRRVGREIQRLVQFVFTVDMTVWLPSGSRVPVSRAMGEADFDEGVVVDTGGGDGLKSHRVACRLAAD